MKNRDVVEAMVEDVVIDSKAALAPCQRSWPVTSISLKGVVKEGLLEAILVTTGSDFVVCSVFKIAPRIRKGGGRVV